MHIWACQRELFFRCLLKVKKHLEFTKVLPPAALWTQSNRGAFSKCPLVEVELDKYYRCWSWIVNNSHTTYHTVIKNTPRKKDGAVVSCAQVLVNTCLGEFMEFSGCWLVKKQAMLDVLLDVVKIMKIALMKVNFQWSCISEICTKPCKTTGDMYGDKLAVINAVSKHYFEDSNWNGRNPRPVSCSH